MGHNWCGKRGVFFKSVWGGGGGGKNALLPFFSCSPDEQAAPAAHGSIRIRPSNADFDYNSAFGEISLEGVPTSAFLDSGSSLNLMTKDM